jgi:hypothetical protein
MLVQLEDVVFLAPSLLMSFRVPAGNFTAEKVCDFFCDLLTEANRVDKEQRSFAALFERF